MRSTSALLYLSGVTVSFDGFKALNNLSLLVEPGEMRAIIGPNGAGKTTMMDVITGKTRPDEGEVVFDGKSDLTKLDEADIATLGIGRKFRSPPCSRPTRCATIFCWRCRACGAGTSSCSRRPRRSRRTGSTRS